MPGMVIGLRYLLSAALILTGEGVGSIFLCVFSSMSREGCDYIVPSVDYADYLNA